MNDPQLERSAMPLRPLRQRLRLALLGGLGALTLWLLRRTWRVGEIGGLAHLRQLADAQQPVIPCCWHQGLLMVVPAMIDAQRPGFHLSFLISPSRDGELAARIVQKSGGRIVRGSATRTGARAMRDLYTLMQAETLSPMNHPDGPNGPAREFKTGTVLLAQLTRAPLLPIGYAADRYWELGSWDRMRIPKPFARISVVIGAPCEVPRKLPLDALEAARIDAQRRLDQAMADAEAAAS